MMSRRRQEVTSVRISDEEYSRLQSKFEALKNEFLACKRKLDSKCEALLILSRELDQCRSERDQFKLMAEQLRERHQSMKKQFSGQLSEPVAHIGPKQYSDKQSQNLVKLIYEARDQTKSSQFELEDNKQKLQDAQGDIKLLREQIARQRVGTTDEGMNTRHFPAHEREELVQKLEASREQYLQLERDLQTVLDEKEELVTERDVYKTKYERLNQELNYILKGDENRVVDIDALVMENKYLQDRMKQMEEEKSMAMAAVTKYKSLLEKRKNKGCMKIGQSRGGGMVISQKHVHEVLTSKAAIVPTPQAMSDLQALAGALLDTVNDKNLALSHQRKTNKILGNRVAELEKKIKTLEVAGLWNVSGHGPIHLEKLLQECNDMKTLIPERVFHQCESDQQSVSDDEKDSELGSVTPLDSEPTSPEPSPTHTAKIPDHLQLGDLDLLPTKEVTCKPVCEESNTEHMTNDAVKTSQSPFDVDSLDKHSISHAVPNKTSFQSHASGKRASSGYSELAYLSSSSFDDGLNIDSVDLCDTSKEVDANGGESETVKEDINDDRYDSADKKSKALENDSEGYDLSADCSVHVYNEDSVDDINGEEEEKEIDEVNKSLDLNLDGRCCDEVKNDFQADGDAESFYNAKTGIHVNGKDYSRANELYDGGEKEFCEEEECTETSEKIGLLVESMAHKMCNISHKTIHKMDSTETGGDSLKESDDSAGSKLLQETDDKSDKNTTAEDEPHNVEC